MSGIPVFVNGARVELMPDSTALDAVRAWNPAAADDVLRGERTLTDSRGLPLAPDARVQAGTIVRLIASRDRDDADEPGD